MTVPANVTRFLFQIPSLPDSLRVVGFDITAAVSDVFRCEVELACESNALNLEALVGKNGLLTLFDERNPQYLHGEIEHIRQGETGNRFTLYTVTLVPKLTFLRYRSNLRIFQQQSVLDIIKQVLQEASIQGQDVRFDVSGRYPVREYCTQYRETDFNFINRLMEEEGLFYLFEHQFDRHVLVISDHNGCFQPIDGQSTVRYKEPTGMVSDQESIYRLGAQASIQSGSVTLRDYFFEKTRLRLEKSEAEGAYSGLEQYHYRGNFTEPAEGARYARVQLEAHQARTHQFEGETDCPRLWPGRRFSVKDHPQQALNTEQTITRVQVQGRQPQSLGEGSSSEGSRFDVVFKAIPATVPFRAYPHTTTPIVEGSQTAFVTGPSGDEIYTDQFGRVKVQFHWDREGQYDETSSCWLRVSQGLAGNEWGAMVIPRIGQEVIVSFLEGNPDRPLVTGSAYNGTNVTPYDLPTHKSRTTFKSFSSPGGGGFNELRIEDKKGQEQIYLRAEKNLDMYIRNDWKEWVGNELHTTVANNLNHQVAADQHTTIKQNHNLKIGQNLSQNIGQTTQLKISGSHVEQAGQDIVLKAGMSLVIEAGVELTLKAGGGLVKLDPSGVTIKGPMVRINTGGAATPGKPATITPPQAPTPADQGEQPGKASASALPNTAPVAQAVASVMAHLNKIDAIENDRNKAMERYAGEGVAGGIAKSDVKRGTKALGAGKAASLSDISRIISDKAVKPSNLTEAKTILENRRKQIAEAGYQPKYSDQELAQLAQHGDVGAERFQVRFMETRFLSSREAPTEHLSGAMGLPMQGATGKGAKYWSTSFDQLEDKDTDPKLISESLGLDYNPKADYTLVIVDTEKAAPFTGVKSVPATFEKVGEFAIKELPDDFPKRFTEKAMTPEFQADYARHYQAAVEQKFLKNSWSKNTKQFNKYLKTTGMKQTDIDDMKLRMLMHDKIGNNQDYLGNGLTKDLNPASPNQFGAVETLNFERKEVNLNKLNETGSITILPGLRPI